MQEINAIRQCYRDGATLQNRCQHGRQSPARCGLTRAALRADGTGTSSAVTAPSAAALPDRSIFSCSEHAVLRFLPPSGGVSLS